MLHHKVVSRMGGAPTWNIQQTWSRQKRKFVEDPIRRNLDEAIRIKKGEPSWWDQFVHFVPLVYDLIGEDEKHAAVEDHLHRLYSKYDLFYQQLSSKDLIDLEKVLMTFVVAHTYLIPIPELGDIFSYDEFLMCQIFKHLPPDVFNKVHSMHCKLSWNRAGATFKNSSVCKFISTLSSRLQREEAASEHQYHENMIEIDEAYEKAAFKQRALESTNLINTLLKKYFPAY